MNEPILVVMAAGLGSRYGGLKQIDPVGKNGELLMHYAIYDALRAGFKNIIFIIRHSMEAEFKKLIGNRISELMDVKYAYQELNALPSGYLIPTDRVKPWGTAHALWCCRNLLDAPFCVINADDFYGSIAFKEIYDFLKYNSNAEGAAGHMDQYVMVGYILRNTITKNGHVARGICKVKNGFLSSVTERTHIEERNNRIQYTENGTDYYDLPSDSIVSMNMWGFTTSFIPELDKQFPAFLDETLKNDPLKGEYFLPSVVNSLLQSGKAKVRVLSSSDKWYGMTYHTDKAYVVDAINHMIGSGIYPEKLW